MWYQCDRALGRRLRSILVREVGISLFLNFIELLTGLLHEWNNHIPYRILAWFTKYLVKENIGILTTLFVYNSNSCNSRSIPNQWYITDLFSSHRGTLTWYSGITEIHKPMLRIQRDTSLTSINIRPNTLTVRNFATPANKNRACPATTVVGMRTEHIKVYAERQQKVRSTATQHVTQLATSCPKNQTYSNASYHPSHVYGCPPAPQRKHHNPD